MSIHADPRRHSLDEEEYKEWQRDLRLEYAREEYEEKHQYDEENITCDYQGEDGSCNCDDHCEYQRGKWKDVCGVWRESEEEDADSD